MFGKDPRQYSVMTTKFLADDDGNVRGLVTVDVEVGKDGIKVSFPPLLSRVRYPPGTACTTSSI